MAEKRTRTALLPFNYAFLYTDLVRVARNHGYALAIHGSMERDLDIIACPWVDDAVSAEELAEAIAEEASGVLLVDHDGGKRQGRDPEQKPHGRLSWSIHLGGGPYIDLSVMPREADGHVRPLHGAG